MSVQFENGVVPIYKLRRGVIVMYDNQYYHIDHVEYSVDRRLVISLSNRYEDFEVMPQFITWLEPM